MFKWWYSVYSNKYTSVKKFEVIQAYILFCKVYFNRFFGRYSKWCIVDRKRWKFELHYVQLTENWQNITPYDCTFSKQWNQYAKLYQSVHSVIKFGAHVIFLPIIHQINPTMQHDRVHQLHLLEYWDYKVSMPHLSDTLLPRSPIVPPADVLEVQLCGNLVGQQGILAVDFKPSMPHL